MKINVCGCSLVDNIYTTINFESETFGKYKSLRNGDGGIAPGKLVFATDLEAFAGKTCEKILSEVTEGKSPDARNLGGPAIVGAVCAAQILGKENAFFDYYGALGDDENGDFIRSKVSRTPVGMTHYSSISMSSSFTDVLSDPNANNGKGERAFINSIGASASVTPETLGDEFFDADVIWFAATALVPHVHDKLATLLAKAKRLGKRTIVSTLYDFRNEKRDPVNHWPLGEDDSSYSNTDLLLVDCEEALRMSGTDTVEKSCAFFIEKGVSAFFITHGAHSFYAWSDGRFFKKTSKVQIFPVSALVDADLAANPEKRGDTTGCGDNFAGGVVSSFIRQIVEGVGDGRYDLLDAAAWGGAAGGAACFQIGGTYIEKYPGEKREILKRYVDDYISTVNPSEAGV